MVARMSVHAMASLREEVLDCIGEHLLIHSASLSSL